MSKAYKCDRCGKLFEFVKAEEPIFDGLVVNSLAVGNIADPRFGLTPSVHSPFDICRDCAKSFTWWWRNVEPDKR